MIPFFYRLCGCYFVFGKLVRWIGAKFSEFYYGKEEAERLARQQSAQEKRGSQAPSPAAQALMESMNEDAAKT